MAPWTRGTAAPGALLCAVVLACVCEVGGSQARVAEHSPTPLHAAFTAAPAPGSRRDARGWPAATCRLRPRILAGVTGLRASNGDSEDLRGEFKQLLGKSGRDMGMKGMKAPKGSLEWLKQQQQAQSAPASPPAAPSNTPGDAAPPLASKPGSPALTGPPAAKPKPKSTAPAPTYSELDALLSGKSPAAPRAPEAAQKIVAPAARPAYAVDSGSTVTLVNLDRGDAVPKDVWSALKDSQGNSLALSKLKAEGGELVLLVPEYAHHTGGPGETWTKLLIDLQNMLGSQPEKVRAVAVSPEPDTVHTKMISRYNLKLFSFASDSDRSFLAAHKVFFFVFLAFIRNPHVHTRTVMMAHARVHTGHTHTHALA